MKKLVVSLINVVSGFLGKPKGKECNTAAGADTANEGNTERESRARARARARAGWEIISIPPDQIKVSETCLRPDLWYLEEPVEDSEDYNSPLPTVVPDGDGQFSLIRGSEFVADIKKMWPNDAILALVLKDVKTDAGTLRLIDRYLDESTLDFDEADAVAELHKRLHATYEELGTILCLDKARVCRYLKTAALPSDIRQQLENSTVHVSREKIFLIACSNNASLQQRRLRQVLAGELEKVVRASSEDD